MPPATPVPSKQRDCAVLRTLGQRLLSHHHSRALSPLPWGGSRTHWRGSRDRPCWGAHATAWRGQGEGTMERGLGWGSRFPHTGACRAPWGLQTQGPVQGCWAPSPLLSTCSTAQSCQCQGCQGNQISSRGCRAPTAQGPAPLGKSLVCPFFPAASGELQCPAHSQSLAPPPQMTHSSIWSVFTL